MVIVLLTLLKIQFVGIGGDLDLKICSYFDLMTQLIRKPDFIDFGSRFFFK